MNKIEAKSYEGVSWSCQCYQSYLFQATKMKFLCLHGVGTSNEVCLFCLEFLECLVSSHDSGRELPW